MEQRKLFSRNLKKPSCVKKNAAIIKKHMENYDDELLPENFEQIAKAYSKTLKNKGFVFVRLEEEEFNLLLCEVFVLIAKSLTTKLTPACFPKNCAPANTCWKKNLGKKIRTSLSVWRMKTAPFCAWSRLKTRSSSNSCCSRSKAENLNFAINS